MSFAQAPHPAKQSAKQKGQAAKGPAPKRSNQELINEPIKKLIHLLMTEDELRIIITWNGELTWMPC